MRTVVDIVSCSVMERVEQWIEKGRLDGESFAWLLVRFQFDQSRLWLWAPHGQLPDELTTDGRGVGPAQDGAIAKTVLAGRRAFATGGPRSVAAEAAAAAVVAGTGGCWVGGGYRCAAEPGHRDGGHGNSDGVFIPGGCGCGCGCGCSVVVPESEARGCESGARGAFMASSGQ